MSDNMKKFLELVSKDEALKKKLQTLNDMEPEKAIQAGIALAKELGIELSEADFANEKSDGELNDDELDAVAGGDCGCAFGGGGSGTDNYGKEYTCGCVAYGEGGHRTFKDYNCLCPFVGAGTDDRFA